MPQGTKKLEEKLRRIQERSERIEDMTKEMRLSERERAKKDEQIVKNARELCKSILKKEAEGLQENEDGTPEKDNVWFRLPTDEMLDQAQKSFERYDGFWKTKIHDAQEINREKTAKIDELQKELEELREGVVQVQRKKEKKKKVRIVNAFAMEEDDDYDEFSRDIAAQTESLNNWESEERRKRNGVFGFLSVAKKEEAEERKNTETFSKEEIEEVISGMTANEKLVLDILGGTGTGDIKGIRDEVSKRLGEAGTKTERTYRGAVADCVAKGLIRQDTDWVVSAPTMGGTRFMCLTKKGRVVYGEISGKKPVLTVYERVRKIYPDVSRGFGVRVTADMIGNSEYYRSRDAVIYCLERRKRLKIDDEQAFLPDITIEMDGERPVYIKYETGTETVHEFAVSANKVFRYSGTMYMIVPNNEVLNIVREYILKWEEAERRKPRIKRVVRFCASTFEDMRYGLGTKDTSGKGKPSVPQWKFAREFAPAPDGETENRMKGEES